MRFYMKIKLFALATIFVLNTHQTHTMESILKWIPFIGSRFNKTAELPKPTFESRPLHKNRDRVSYALFLDQHIVINDLDKKNNDELKQDLEYQIPGLHAQ